MNNPSSSAKWVNLIKALYSYFMLIVSIFLLVSGIGSAIRIVVYGVIFDKYPLPEERYLCSVVPPVDGEKPTQEEENCNEVIEQARKIKFADDIIYATISTIAGFGILIPHIFLVRSVHSHKD